MYSVELLIESGKGKSTTHSSANCSYDRFAPEYVVLFLCLCDLGSKGCRKATTHNCVPLGRCEGDCLQTCALLSLLSIVVLNSYKQCEYIML